MALDFGSGTGNLTNHLFQLGAKVIAADVSENYLSQLSKRYIDNDQIQFERLNGKNLSTFSESQFDIFATYSVLHYIPDNLAAIKELIRFTKSGGIIYFDHKFDEHNRYRSKVYENFLKSSITKTE